jgi:hypothetical protein
LVWSGGYLVGDGVAGGLEFGDLASDDACGDQPVVVVAAEVVVVLTGAQHVPDGDDYGVFGGNQGFLVAAAGGEAAEPSGQESGLFRAADFAAIPRARFT